MTLKLYSDAKSPLLHKILIAAKYGNIDVEVTPEFVVGKDNLTPEFLQKNPLGKVPVLETPEGPIWESNAIARYIARLDDKTHLLGQDEYENGLVDQWLDFASGELGLPARVWLYPILGFMENNQGATNKAKGDVRKVLDILNTHLSDRTFFVGERVTLADISIATILIPLYAHVLDPGFRKPFSHLFRWFNTVVNQPQFKEVVPQVTFAQKMAVAPSTGEKEPKQEKKEPKQEKKQPQEKPPQEKKQQKKKKKEDEDEDEDEEIHEEKPKDPNPLDLLPPSPFNLDEWKRMYSNSKVSESIPWFWEKFDPLGWSLWISKYKYNKELDILFRVNNLVGGFLQRLDKLRKYGFGSVIIFGEENNFEIEGAWLFRGQEVPQEMKDCDDCELYDWVKADHTNEQDRKIVSELFAWEGEFGGKKFIDQGKVFK